NSRTAKMRKILYLSCEHIKMVMQKFREAENGFPKAFLLTSSPDAYRTIVRQRRQFPRLRAFFIV
ncbi:MAG: hypothetical protein IJ045_02705, partial [Ruminiclostridium sp.]|nr:hypothetical protein [Ruminiclostridium sp.]